MNSPVLCREAGDLVHFEIDFLVLYMKLPLTSRRREAILCADL